MIAQGFALVAGAFMCYAIAKAIQRIYFHPLAKIPGPKLAAATQCYEMYFDLIQQARMPWQLEALHARYGPIVRFAPNEVHINDPSFTSTFFSSGSAIKMNKYDYHALQFGMPESTFNTCDADVHKIRRGALNPFFSRKSINALEPMIAEKVEKVSSRLQEFKQNQTPLDLRLLFSCFTSDVISDYCFPKCFDYLSTDDLAPWWRNSFAEGLRNFQWLKHFPGLWIIMRAIPYDVLNKVSPKVAITLNWDNSNKILVRDLIDSYDDRKDQEQTVTIFNELLTSDLPPHEKSYERLWQEGSAMIGAGVETTSNTLTTALYWLTQRPEALARLKAELETAMPNPDLLLPWAKLETLPYLSAVIKEALRSAGGFSSRMVRVPQNAPLRYKNYVLPPGTAIGMSQKLLSRHPDLFDTPHEFDPERWLTKNGPADLYSFGRGPRMCVAQNLAYAELYLALAAIVRRFNLQLFQTDYSDIECVCDAFFPMPRSDTKGVQVLVT